MFVDASEYEFAAYNAVGLALLGDDQAQGAEAAKNLRPPDFGMGEWFRYLTNVIKLSPVPTDGSLKFGDVPEGVKRLGGTFVIKGGKVSAAWEDPLPGSYPVPSEVLPNL